MLNNDYILRRDALNEFHEWIVSNDGNIFSLADALEIIPAADVEPVRHGQWIPIHELRPDGYPLSVPTCFWCNQCKYSSESPRKFCPNCGAKMNAEPSKEKKDD